MFQTKCDNGALDFFGVSPNIPSNKVLLREDTNVTGRVLIKENFALSRETAMALMQLFGITLLLHRRNLKRSVKT